MGRQWTGIIGAVGVLWRMACPVFAAPNPFLQQEQLQKARQEQRKRMERLEISLLLWISHDGLAENPKDTICSVQMLLNGNTAQRAANPLPLCRRNGPPPLKRADRKTGGREGRDCGSPLQHLCRTLGKTSPKRFSPSILFLRLQETHRLQRRRGSPQGNPSRPPRGQIHSKANARHLASIGR